MVALPESGLAELALELERRRGVPVKAIEADLTEASALLAIEDLVEAESLELDLLVNNAGIGFVGPFMSRPVDEHESVIRLNALALVRITRLFLDSARGRRGLRILNVASLGASFPMPSLAVYSATKSFVFSYSLALRAELAGRVGVSVLCPNAMRTTGAVEDYVARFGPLARLACLAPERVAREALDGALANRAVIVPGAFNRALAAAGRIVPRNLAMRAIGSAWGGFAGGEA